MFYGTVLEQIAETVLGLTNGSLLKIIFGVDHTLEHGQLARLADLVTRLTFAILFDQLL